MPPPPTSLPSTLLHTLQTHTAPVNALTFSHGAGTYILTGSSDRQIHLNRTEPQSPSSEATVTTTPIQRYTSHGYAILSLSVTTSNTTFASSSADRSGPFLWDIHTPTSTLRRFGSSSPSPHTSRITTVTFTAHDTILVSGSDDTSVRLWDVKSRDNRPLMILDDARDGITAVKCWDREIIVGSTDGRVRSYDVRMGRVVVDVFGGSVTSLDVSRDGKVVLVGCLDGRMRVLEREGGRCLRTVPGMIHEKDTMTTDTKSGYVNSTLRLQSCLAVNDSLVLSGSESDGKVRAWDLVSGKQIGSVNVNESGKVVSVVKWREGSVVEERRGVWAAGGADGMVRVYG